MKNASIPFSKLLFSKCSEKKEKKEKTHYFDSWALFLQKPFYAFAILNPIFF